MLLLLGSLPLLTLPTAEQVGKEVQGFHSWKKVNAQPVELNYWVSALCIGPSAEQRKRMREDPHALKLITVRVNKTGEAAMMRGGTFPVGSVIVKEKLSQLDPSAAARSDKPIPELSTVMIKRATGFNPKCGDWEFAVLDSSGSKVTDQGKLPTCMSCHVEMSKQDFVYRTYVPTPAKAPRGG